MLNNYRKFVFAAMMHPKLDKAVIAAFNYMHHYSHQAYASELYFVTEVIAYDMGALLERAHDQSVRLGCVASERCIDNR